MTYPFEVGGVADYPVKVGSMLLTLVDPNRGFEKAYNRWYERDHFYEGCMVGPYCFAGSRWVATRELKGLRWGDDGEGAPVSPIDAGSFVAIYWAQAGHHDDHFNAWSRPQVAWIYANGRGFAERKHAHTVLFDHIGATYRDVDPVPVELALDHRYDGLIVAWFDAIDGTAADLHSRLAEEYLPGVLADSAIEIAASWTPSPGEDEVRKHQPMDLGGPPGGAERLVQLFFCHGDVRESLEPIRHYTAAVRSVAKVRLVAPFFRTVPGTDRYVDQIW